MDRENNKVCLIRFLGRNVRQAETFDYSSEDWDAKNQAESWLKFRGYTFGSTDDGTLVAISAKEEYPFAQKWKNFSEAEKGKVSGAISSSDYRKGPVDVYLFEYSKSHKRYIQDIKFGAGLHKCTPEFRKRILEGRDKVRKADIKNIAYHKQIADGSVDSKLDLQLINQELML